jgi:hypothetical protein
MALLRISEDLKRQQFTQTVAYAAAALVLSASAQHDPQACTDSDSNAAAAAAVAAMLPSVFIMGRDCMHGSQKLQSSAFMAKIQLQETREPCFAEVALSAVQQWLETNSTQEQLVAAGCAP